VNRERQQRLVGLRAVVNLHEPAQLVGKPLRFTLGLLVVLHHDQLVFPLRADRPLRLEAFLTLEQTQGEPGI
jgi:hypothetical protein